MAHVAADRHFETLDVALAIADCQKVEQALRRMRMAAVACIDDDRTARMRGESPFDFLAWMSKRYASISVLHRDGSMEDCADADAVMKIWRRVNEAAGMDGRVHLDLLFRPERSDNAN